MARSTGTAGTVSSVRLYGGVGLVYSADALASRRSRAVGRGPLWGLRFRGGLPRLTARLEAEKLTVVGTHDNVPKRIASPPSRLTVRPRGGWPQRWC